VSRPNEEFLDLSRHRDSKAFRKGVQSVVCHCERGRQAAAVLVRKNDFLVLVYDP
jgi:hypothetical protein